MYTPRMASGQSLDEFGGLEDVTAEELEAKSDRLQPSASGPRDSTHEQVGPLPGETPLLLQNSTRYTISKRLWRYYGKGLRRSL